MTQVIRTTFILLLTLVNTVGKLCAQQYNCAFKAPVVKIDFGSGDIRDVNATGLPKYRRNFTTCPPDGFYSYASSTSNCFNGDWLTIKGDHTGNGPYGNMMLVNASETGGTFFSTYMYGFPAGATFQLSLWMMNVCRINGGCTPLPPNITISLTAPGGRKIAVFKTGLLAQGYTPAWRKFTGFFQTPPGVTSFHLTMADITLGGCGNDFVLDDIIIQECITSTPQVKSEPTPVRKEPIKLAPVIVQKPAIKLPDLKKTTAITQQHKRDTVAYVTKPITGNKLEGTAPVVMKNSMSIKSRPIIKLPEPIVTRANPIVKNIESATGYIQVDLYDNGEIDGDTVSVYHNNELIVSREVLSDKPISFKIAIDKTQPHHELIMVANNLGSIPPNTSMMIINAAGKRYEVFISSSEEKNARVVFDLKE